MDLMMIDVSHLENVDLGEEVVLLEKQGSEEISAHELAERAGTITWEITTRIAARVRRVYI
jgi:alanine racemase